ncbi:MULTISPECIES: hypothetical protein [unclassified Novosphingobium]|nr:MULTISPECIES: hypothetical protein [unclassified Novosphingobium]NKJ40847.1 hypothetical protein [Novosphingobium sp. SG720]NMN03091.1 hypothetical protein [Novosphingobium sp. SG919]NMN86921.1 hypothetical protein [Novosphingobium sp. SG916]
MIDAAGFLVRPFGWLALRGAELFARLRRRPYRRETRADRLPSLRRGKPD